MVVLSVSVRCLWMLSEICFFVSYLCVLVFMNVLGGAWDLCVS